MKKFRFFITYLTLPSFINSILDNNDLKCALFLSLEYTNKKRISILIHEHTLSVHKQPLKLIHHNP